MDRASGEVHKLAKKNKTSIFPVRTEQASSIKDYCGSILNFFASIEHLYRLNARALLRRKPIAFVTPFPQNFCKIFGEPTRKRLLLNAKTFPFEYLFMNTNQ